MIRFVMKNNLYLMTGLALGTAVFLAVRWEIMPALQRMSGLFFIGLVMHLWEEGRFPGGFVELIAAHLQFKAISREFGEIVTAAYALLIAFVPILFPQVQFLAMSAMMLGIMEAIMHTAMIRMFRMKHFYSPGLVTVLVVLLPISLYTFFYVAIHHPMRPYMWILSFAYMLLGLMVAQQIVIRASGMKYADFLKSIRTALSSNSDQAK